MPNLNDPPRKGRFDPAIEDKRLRDQFAGRAMEALLKDLKLMMALAEGAGMSVEDFIGKTMYQIADSGMKARDAK